MPPSPGISQMSLPCQDWSCSVCHGRQPCNPSRWMHPEHPLVPLAVPLSQLDPQGLAEHSAKKHTRLQGQWSFVHREMFPISTGTPQRADPRPANTPGQHARGWSTASKSNCSHTIVGYHSGAKAILRLPQLPTAWELASKATRVKGASTEHPCQAQGVASTELQPGWDGCLALGCSSPGSG